MELLLMDIIAEYLGGVPRNWLQESVASALGEKLCN